ncbi:MFS transporter [Chloroflexota bacterium]
MNVGSSKKATLFIVTMISFVVPFLDTSVAIALPSIAEEFSMSAVLTGWVATSFLLAGAVSLLPFGRFADIHGRKRIFIYGVLVFTLASLICAISTSAISLISFRVLQGIGSAMIFSTGVAILISVFPANERGRILGINVAAVYIGLSLGPFGGGFLVQHLGWRSIFLVTIPISFAVIALVLWKLKGEWAEAKGESFDRIGFIIYSLSLIAIMYGFSLLPDMLGLSLVLLGVLGIFTFVQWEKKAESPIFNVSLFRNNATFAFSNLAALFNYSANFAVIFLLSLYLQYIKGFSPQIAGLILVAQPIVMAIFSPFAGKLSDRIEPRIVASIGMALTLVGLLSFAFLTEVTGVWFIIIILIILGFGFALFSSPNANAVMSSVEKKFLGVASATLATMRMTGQMFSMGIVMIVFAIYIGRVQITPEYYPPFLISAKVAFIIFTALCFGGIFALLARGRAKGIA